MKQRYHEPIGTAKDAVDRYPEIDCYIPEAERIANITHPDKSVKYYNAIWSKCFLKSMDTILKKAGLRF